MKTFTSVALGCKVNAYEVFSIEETLKAQGYNCLLYTSLLLVYRQVC